MRRKYRARPAWRNRGPLWVHMHSSRSKNKVSEPQAQATTANPPDAHVTQLACMPDEPRQDQQADTVMERVTNHEQNKKNKSQTEWRQQRMRTPAPQCPIISQAVCKKKKNNDFAPATLLATGCRSVLSLIWHHVVAIYMNLISNLYTPVPKENRRTSIL